jgi:hypothetical protein
MAQCPNCKKNMSCGCQKRTSAEGVVGCTSCITGATNAKQSTTSNNKNNTLKKFWGPELHTKIK